MKNIIKEWWLGTPTIECLSSKVARGYLLLQIENKYGKEIAAETNLEEDLKTFARWHFEGHRVKPGEKSLYGVKLVPRMDEGNEKTIRKPKPVRLFHRLQTKCVRY